MSYFLLEPEVAGGLGDDTVMDTDTHPPRITRLHYAIDDWRGDELLESFPAFIITQNLADAINQAGLTGFTLADAKVTLSDTGIELLGDTTLPTFRWLQITGKPSNDDFALTNDNTLTVSKRALETLQTGNIDNCDIEDAPARS